MEEWEQWYLSQPLTVWELGEEMGTVTFENGELIIHSDHRADELQDLMRYEYALSGGHRQTWAEFFVKIPQILRGYISATFPHRPLPEFLQFKRLWSGRRTRRQDEVATAAS